MESGKLQQSQVARSEKCDSASNHTAKKTLEASFWKVPKTFRTPEKQFVKLQPAYSVNLDFAYVVNGIKIKITAKFLGYKENYVTRNALERSRDFEKSSAVLSNMSALRCAAPRF